VARKQFHNRRHLHNGFPSATEVLGLYVDWSQVPEGVLEHAAKRGTKVHETCGCIASGVPYMRGIDEECAPYVKSFQDWFDAVVEEVYLVEERLYDKVLGYCGQMDLVLLLKGDAEASLWDIKTGAAEGKTWAAQVASYRHMVNEQIRPVGRAGSIRLDKNGGRAKLSESGDVAADFGAFVNALVAYRYFLLGG